MRHVLATLITCLLTACLADAPASASVITIDVTASVGPAGNDVKLSQDGESPYYGGFADRAVKYMETGSTPLGDPRVDPTAYQVITSTTAHGLIATPTFNSWRGQANPTGHFANEHGNMLYFSFHITGNGSTGFRLVDLAYEVTSSDPDNRFGFSGSYSNEQINGYTDHRIGIDWGADGVKGGGDDIIYTAGNGETFVDEIVSVGVGVFNEPDGTGTEQEQLDEIIAMVNAEAPFDITAKYTLVGLLGGPFAVGEETVTVTPEPTSGALLGVAALGLLMRRRRGAWS